MPGRRIGPYHLGTRIGAGAMGEVYRARDPALRRDIAIKLLPRAHVVPGSSGGVYAFSRPNVPRNLYRIPIW
jgi:serine/threonine protein kinase